MANTKGMRSAAYEVGKCRIRVTTQRRWWQWSRVVIGVELWLPVPDSHGYAYGVWKPTL